MEMDKGAIGWLHRYARKNLWRVPSWYEYNDLVQDGCLHWERITSRYGSVKERAHMMRLFQVCFINHVTNLANKRTQTLEEVVPDVLYLIEQFQAEYHSMFETSMPQLKILLDEAPDELLAVLRLFETDEGISRLLRPTRRRRGGYRETWSEKLSRVAKIDTDVELVSKLRQYVMDGSYERNAKT